MRELAFLFVADGPRLEAQALVLAVSLRRNHPEAQIFGYRPTSDPPPQALAAAFEAIGAKFGQLAAAPGLWRKPYPHGNKLRALAAARPGMRVSVFLDTDMAMAAPLRPQDLPDPGEIGVVPEGIGTWGRDPGRWDRVYAHFGLATPEERIRLLRGRRRPSPPYFNAGFVAQREDDLHDGHAFGRHWHDTAREIDWNVAVGGKRPWLDQIAMPVAMRRFGYTPKILDEACNFSISNGRKLPDPFEPRIVHYHRARFLRDWAGGNAAIEHALSAVPSRHRQGAEAMLKLGGFVGPDDAEA